MKKLLLILMLLVTTPLAFAGRGGYINRTLSATGADTVSLGGNQNNASSYVLQYTAVITPATLSIKLQGSILGDFTDAADCGVAVTNVNSGSIVCIGIYARVRVNITTLTGASAAINYTLSSIFEDMTPYPTGTSAQQTQGSAADGSTLTGINPVAIGMKETSTGFNRYLECVLSTSCIPKLTIRAGSWGDTSSPGYMQTNDGTVSTTPVMAINGGHASFPSGNTVTALSPIVNDYVYPLTTSATNTAQTIIIDTHNLHDILAIRAACGVGTAALTVEGCTDSTCATSPLTLDSIAAAATQIKFYNASTVGATVALPPLAYRWVRVTIASCGVGNTSTLQMAGK